MKGERAKTAGNKLALAHELRTPLTALTLAADMLEDERHGSLTTAQRELARTIAREAGRLRLVLDRALRTDRLGAHAGPIDRAPLDFGRLVRSALRPLRAQARPHEVTIAERLATSTWVVGDSAKLAWVAASLVGNALRFSPPGSSVDVRVWSANDQASLRVRDRGPGIPRSKRQAIFAREAGGTLFLIQEVVHAHGGTIRVVPTTIGASFIVSLPLARAVDEEGE